MLAYSEGLTYSNVTTFHLAFTTFDVETDYKKLLENCKELSVIFDRDEYEYIQSEKKITVHTASFMVKNFNDRKEIWRLFWSCHAMRTVLGYSPSEMVEKLLS